jgi:hypothetical protein
VSESDNGLREVIEDLRRKWGAFPERISEIPNLPYADFASLRAAITQRHVVLQRFSSEYGSTVFGLFAQPAERAYVKFISFVGFAAPIIGLVLAFAVSWWWVIPGILTPIFVIREHKKIYNGVIYRGAFSSEQGFCFLYRVGQVCLTSPDYRNSLYWKE